MFIVWVYRIFHRFEPSWKEKKGRYFGAWVSEESSKFLSRIFKFLVLTSSYFYMTCSARFPKTAVFLVFLQHGRLSFHLRCYPLAGSLDPRSTAASAHRSGASRRVRAVVLDRETVVFRRTWVLNRTMYFIVVPPSMFSRFTSSCTCLLSLLL